VDWDTPDGIPQPSKPGHPGYALVCDDVAGLSVDGFAAASDSDGTPVVRLADVHDALLRGCVAAKETKVFLEAAGERTRGVILTSCALGGAEKTVSLASGVEASAVAVRGE
jgi:hypothetical protein